MASTTYKKLVVMIRCRREMIATDILGRNFETFRAATEVMCATWYVKGQIEKMREDLNDLYLDDDRDLTRREYKALDNYIDNLDDYYWNLLYNEASKISSKLYRRGDII